MIRGERDSRTRSEDAMAGTLVVQILNNILDTGEARICLSRQPLSSFLRIASRYEAIPNSSSMFPKHPFA